jgi:hypothetical protein
MNAKNNFFSFFFLALQKHVKERVVSFVEVVIIVDDCCCCHHQNMIFYFSFNKNKKSRGSNLFFISKTLTETSNGNRA